MLMTRMDLAIASRRSFSMAPTSSNLSNGIGLLYFGGSRKSDPSPIIFKSAGCSKKTSIPGSIAEVQIIKSGVTTLFFSILLFMNQAEIELGDLLIPWILVISTIGFLLAWLVMAILEYTGLSRFVWHLPLFFIALVVLFASLIGILFRP